MIEAAVSDTAGLVELELSVDNRGDHRVRLGSAERDDAYDQGVAR